MDKRRVVYLGWDARERQAFSVAERSLLKRTSVPLQVRTILMAGLVSRGLYTRPTELRGAQLWDVISNAPMSTSHAIARFYVPLLNDYRGWALFADGDILVRDDVAKLFAMADDRCAVMVVKHNYRPAEGVKMDGQIQTTYARKNWSSVILWNCGHPSNRQLGVDVLNALPGRDLHRFCWLSDDEVGAIPPEWNHLVNVEPLPARMVAIAHFTLGTPDMPGYEDSAFADEWRQVLSSPPPAADRDQGSLL